MCNIWLEPCNSLEDMKVNILRVWLENAYSRPQNYGFGEFDLLNGKISKEPSKGTSLRGKTLYDVL